MASASTTYRLTTTPTTITLTAATQVIISNIGEAKVLVGLGTPYTNAAGHPLPRYGDSLALTGTNFTQISVSTDEVSGSGVNGKLASAVVTIVTA